MNARAQSSSWRDPGVALLLALVLGAAWAARDWANLSALNLPDTDDVMRLQQIRDWIGGQAFGDLSQHRLGDGVQMHWSRLADLVPAATIVGLTPLVGGQAAQVAAVIAWPILLFVGALWLMADIARRLGTSGPLAAVVAALAHPATTVFMPGRIDHHGLQLVLLLGVVRGLVAAPGLAGGAWAGIATTLSLAVGLETAPLLAIGGTAVVLGWVRTGDRRPLSGYAATLALSLAVVAILLRTSGWNYPACDGFTAQLWRAAQFASLAPLALAGLAFVTLDPHRRLLAALAIGGVGIGAALLVSPGCLHPYGIVDPLLARLWLDNVAEAQPLFAAPLAQAISYGGFALIAGTVTVMQARRNPRWRMMAAMQLGAIVLMMFQMRGAYAAVLLGVPAMAALIEQARTRGQLWLVPAWILSAGLLYPIAGTTLDRRPMTAPTQGCDRAGIVAHLAALPTGTVVAPIDIGAYAIAATSHRVIAAPYHRNSAGNRALYAFFLGTEEQARAIAGIWRIDYVIDCPTSFAELQLPAAAFVTDLRKGRPPAWLRPMAQGIYRVAR